MGVREGRYEVRMAGRKHGYFLREVKLGEL
jgi:hypothetical protein